MFGAGTLQLQRFRGKSNIFFHFLKQLHYLPSTTVFLHKIFRDAQQHFYFCNKNLIIPSPLASHAHPKIQSHWTVLQLFCRFRQACHFGMFNCNQTAYFPTHCQKSPVYYRFELHVIDQLIRLFQYMILQFILFLKGGSFA